MTGERLQTVLSGIDAANSSDPNSIDIAGQTRPRELIYGERMSRALERLYPEASEHLRIAARGQHIERWTSPRSGYPMTRNGYLRWRNELKRYHANRVGEIMKYAGYFVEDIERVQDLIRKHRLKLNAEAQALEDVVCIVFLEDYFTDFASKHEDAKVIDILRKTWVKMSPHGREFALKLEMPAKARELVAAALADSTAAG